MCLCRVGAPLPVLGAPCAKRHSGCAHFWEWVLGRARELFPPDLQPLWCGWVWHCVWLLECGTLWEVRRPPLLLLTTSTTGWCGCVAHSQCGTWWWEDRRRVPGSIPPSSGSHLVTICWNGFGSVRSFSFSFTKIQFACLASDAAHLLSNIPHLWISPLSSSGTSAGSVVVSGKVWNKFNSFSYIWQQSCKGGILWKITRL